MPYVAHLPIHKGTTHIKNSLEYISKEEKAYKVTGINCPVELEAAIALFENASCIRGKRAKNQAGSSIIAHHYYQSFLPGSANADEVHKMGVELANIIAPGYMAHVATHIDKDHVHNHIIICSVHPETGYKYRHCWDQFKFVQEQSDALCEEAGMQIIEKPKRGKYKSKEYRAMERGESWKDKLAWDIDDAVKSAVENSTGKKGFVDYLKSKGYEVKWQNKNISIRLPGNKAVRIDTLARTYGGKYKKDSIERRLRREEPNADEIQVNDRNQLPKHMKYGDTERFNEYDRYIEWCKKNKVEAKLELKKRSPPRLEIYKPRSNGKYKAKDYIKVDKDNAKRQCYPEEKVRKGEKTRTWKDRLALDIDEAIMAARESGEGKECFIKVLEEKGYIVKYQNKNISVQIPGRKAIRVDTLAKTHGSMYAKEYIERRLEGASDSPPDAEVKHHRASPHKKIMFIKFANHKANPWNKNGKTKDEREMEKELEELGRFLSKPLRTSRYKAKTMKGKWRIKEKKEWKRERTEQVKKGRER